MDGSTPDDTVGEGRMYTRQGDPMCPVSSFKKYLGKLHPDIDKLWQRPLESYEENQCVWYYKNAHGKKCPCFHDVINIEKSVPFQRSTQITVSVRHALQHWMIKASRRAISCGPQVTRARPQSEVIRVV